MPLEIERKFLLKNDSWKNAIARKIAIIDGLIARGDISKVRVRIADGAATIAVKSDRVGMTRSEFEYPIPLSHAQEMLETVCDHTLEKERYLVTHGQNTWTVDIYQGDLSGIQVAEIELTSEKSLVELPDWVDREVTNDPAYKKINIVLARTGVVPEPR